MDRQYTTRTSETVADKTRRDAKKPVQPANEGVADILLMQQRFGNQAVQRSVFAGSEEFSGSPVSTDPGGQGPDVQVTNTQPSLVSDTVTDASNPSTTSVEQANESPDVTLERTESPVEPDTQANDSNHSGLVPEPLSEQSDAQSEQTESQLESDTEADDSNQSGLAPEPLSEQTDVDSEQDPGSTDEAATTNVDTEPSSPLIVGDEVNNVRPGQMNKTEFLDQVRTDVNQTVAEILAPTGRTTKDCPYLDFVFKFTAGRSAKYIDRLVRQFLPSEASSITTADETTSWITERVRQSTEAWVRTGEITGLPSGLPTGLRSSVFAAGSRPAPAAAAGAMSSERVGGATNPSDPQALQSQLGAGHPLESGVRSRMETAFDHNFSDVRVHTDETARDLSSSHDARAFTVGEHVAFGPGEYRPGTLAGDALVAHELAHVLQQAGADRTTADTDSGRDQALERDADSAVAGAAQIFHGGMRGLMDLTRKAVPQLRSGLRLQRCERTTATPAPAQVVAGPTFSSAAFNKGKGGKVTFKAGASNAKLFSSAYSSSGKVKVSGGTDAQAKDWEAGFIQTLVSRTGAGHYKGSKKHSTHAWTIPGPLRDALDNGGAPWYDPKNVNGPGRVPFAKTDSTVKTSLWDKPQDWFPWDTPDSKGKLNTSDGKHKFAMWMIARQKSSPNTIHYLNWAVWEVDWSAGYNYASKGAKTTSSITGATKVTDSGAGKGAETPVLSGPIVNPSQKSTWS